MMGRTEESELRLMLVGKSSAGKSATGNTILGEKKFNSSASSTSVDKTCKKERVECKGRTIVVVDTPGTFDTDLTPEQVVQEVGACVNFSPPGPHAIVLVLRIGRYTEEEKKTIERILDAFGDQAMRYMIVLFTRKDDLEDVSIHDYVKNTRSADLQELIQKCGNRYCAFNNRATPGDQMKQVTELLTMIERMVEQNNGTWYTTEMYKQAEKIHLEKLEEQQRQKRNPLEIEKEKLKQQFEEEAKKIEEEAKIRQKEIIKCFENKNIKRDDNQSWKQNNEKKRKLYTNSSEKNQEACISHQDSDTDFHWQKRTNTSGSEAALLKKQVSSEFQDSLTPPEAQDSRHLSNKDHCGNRQTGTSTLSRTIDGNSDLDRLPVGESGTDKSASGNTNHGKKRFNSRASSSSGDKTSREKTGKGDQEIEKPHGKEEATDEHIDRSTVPLHNEEERPPIMKQPRKNSESNHRQSRRTIAGEHQIDYYELETSHDKEASTGIGNFCERFSCEWLLPKCRWFSNSRSKR